MLTYIVLFYDFLPILSRSSKSDLYMRGQEPVEPRGSPVFWCHPQEHCPPPSTETGSLPGPEPANQAGLALQ